MPLLAENDHVCDTVITTGSGLEQGWETKPVVVVFLMGECQFPAIVLFLLVLLCMLCWYLLVETLWQMPEGR